MKNTNLNVTLFFRPPSGNRHSIETVFDLVKKDLQNDVNFTEYYCTNELMRIPSIIKARKYGGDINHITGDVHTIGMFLDPKKTIITVHDIAHLERDLHGIKKRFFKKLWLELPLRRVKHITTISDFTKNTIIEAAGIDPAKVTVIHNPAPTDFFYVAKEYDMERPSILQIGSSRNKNIYRLIEAIKGTSFRLILIRNPDPQLKTVLDDSHIQYEWKSNITRAEVKVCYERCDIVFFASEFEGFGVPILEGNSVGRPVITSRIESMPEVAGDAALLVDPFSVDDIRNALLKINGDSSVRQLLVKNGLENIKRFSVEKTTRKYLDIYNMLGSNY
jgi:glycosyltransferase involved in cell wall biosynthesis